MKPVQHALFFRIVAECDRRGFNHNRFMHVFSAARDLIGRHVHIVNGDLQVFLLFAALVLLQVAQSCLVDHLAGAAIHDTGLATTCRRL